MGVSINGQKCLLIDSDVNEHVPKLIAEESITEQLVLVVCVQNHEHEQSKCLPRQS